MVTFFSEKILFAQNFSFVSTFTRKTCFYLETIEHVFTPLASSFYSSTIVKQQEMTTIEFISGLWIRLGRKSLRNEATESTLNTKRIFRDGEINAKEQPTYLLIRLHKAIVFPTFYNNGNWLFHVVELIVS